MRSYLWALAALALPPGLSTWVLITTGSKPVGFLVLLLSAMTIVLLRALVRQETGEVLLSPDSDAIVFQDEEAGQRIVFACKIDTELGACDLCSGGRIRADPPSEDYVPLFLCPDHFADACDYVTVTHRRMRAGS